MTPLRMVLAGLLVAGLGAGVSASVPEREMGTCPGPAPPEARVDGRPLTFPAVFLDDPVNALTLQQFARVTFPDLYAGLSGGVSTTIAVHRKPSPGSPLDAAMRAKFPDEPLAFRDAPLSERELVDLWRSVNEDRASWKFHRITFRGVARNPYAGVVEVRIAQPATPGLTEAFRARYGPDVVLSGCAPDFRMF
jgi:hypothetical protein